MALIRKKLRFGAVPRMQLKSLLGPSMLPASSHVEWPLRACLGERRYRSNSLRPDSVTRWAAPANQRSSARADRQWQTQVNRTTIERDDEEDKEEDGEEGTEAADAEDAEEDDRREGRREGDDVEVSTRFEARTARRPVSRWQRLLPSKATQAWSSAGTRTRQRVVRGQGQLRRGYTVCYVTD